MEPSRNGALDLSRSKRDTPDMQFKNVTAVAAGNVYFEGKVDSHTIVMPDGAKKTLGVIMPGSYHFGTCLLYTSPSPRDRG